MILELTSFICAQSWRLRRSTAVENPHSRSWCLPQPTASLTCSRSAPVRVRSLQELLGLQVQGRALLDDGEALDLQGSTSLLAGNHPGVGLAPGARLLAHNLASLVPRQVLRCEATNSLRLAAAEHHCLGHAALCDLAHGLLLHGLHGLHCLHRLRHC